MINIQIANELMVEFGNSVYEILESRYPRFLRQEWADKVSYSRLLLSGNADQEDLDVVQSWVDFENSVRSPENALTAIVYAHGIILENREFVKMRQALSAHYKLSAQLVATTASTDFDALPGVLTGVIDKTRGLMVVLSKGDQEVMLRLSDALEEMQVALTEAIGDGT